jgi:hypothetical protein
VVSEYLYLVLHFFLYDTFLTMSRNIPGALRLLTHRSLYPNENDCWKHLNVYKWECGDSEVNTLSTINTTRRIFAHLFFCLT